MAGKDNANVRCDHTVFHWLIIHQAWLYVTKTMCE